MNEAQLERLLRQADRAIARERRLEPEWEERFAPRPEIQALCAEATQLADHLRKELRRARTFGAPLAEIKRIQARGFRWISQKTQDWLPKYRTLEPAELDWLNGCITRVSSAIGAEPRRLGTLRRSIERRLGMPSPRQREFDMAAEFEG